MNLGYPFDGYPLEDARGEDRSLTLPALKDMCAKKEATLLSPLLERLIVTGTSFERLVFGTAVEAWLWNGVLAIGIGQDRGWAVDR